LGRKNRNETNCFIDGGSRTTGLKFILSDHKDIRLLSIEETKRKIKENALGGLTELI